MKYPQRRIIVAGNHQQYRDCLRVNGWKEEDVRYAFSADSLRGIPGQSLQIILTGQYEKSAFMKSPHLSLLIAEGAELRRDVAGEARTYDRYEDLPTRRETTGLFKGMIARVVSIGRMFVFMGWRATDGADDPPHRTALLLMGKPLEEGHWQLIDDTEDTTVPVTLEHGIQIEFQGEKHFWTGSGWSRNIAEAAKFRSAAEADDVSRCIHPGSIPMGAVAQFSTPKAAIFERRVAAPKKPAEYLRLDLRMPRF